MSRFKLLSLVFSGAVLAACGGGGSDSPAVDSGSSATAAPQTTAPEASAPATTASSDTAAPTAEKLFGTWEQCEVEGGTSSRRAYWFANNSDKFVTFALLIENFSSGDCSGTRESYYSHEAFGVLEGDKKAQDGANVAKLRRTKLISRTGGPRANGTSEGWTIGGKPMIDPDKIILSISEAGLRVGDRGNADAEGYSDELRPGFFKKK
ncbi:hypothetical protein JI739_17955 [Ramlibacter sp. AW1]|uniref:Lipoprotein n=1 Tax=Ramlibacter aurantiacus TaxID=2801330 RepID=A0A936ZLY8_9BURK|nr:hypothetical protein [Ramlibacter aurantiacus]MBL0422237.1 hypothetical protein [Ramlibacter aurantiacus]